MPRTSFSPKIRVPPQVFPQRVKVARAVQTLEAGAGGRVVTPPDKAPVIYENVPASIQDTGAKEMTIQGRLLNVLTHAVYTPMNMEVFNGDFILFNARVFVIQTIRDVSQLKALFLISCIEYAVQPTT